MYHHQRINIKGKEIMKKNKPFYRVKEDGYCTFCHEEGAHKEDCLVAERPKQDNKKEKRL